MIQIIPEVIDTIGGRKRVKVTLRDGDNIIDADVLDPMVARQRARVAQRLAERSGDASATERIEQALLQCVELIASETPNASAASADDPNSRTVVPVVPVSGEGLWVVRPELLVTPPVVGLTVPQTVIKGSLALGRWRLMLAWSDGKRETRELVATGAPIEVPESMQNPGASGAPKRLWLHPIPPPPSVPTVSAWSDASQELWLNGD